MTRYWGVCHPDGSIVFSRALLDQAAAFQDLVIVHELIHLEIRDHSKWFYLALSLYLPEHRAISRLAPENPAKLSPTKSTSRSRPTLSGGR
jgi:predicted metal-dependent hydrolase